MRNANVPQVPESGATFPASSFDLVMHDLLLKQAGKKVYLAGDPIWSSSSCGGWAETCTIVAAPTSAILDPDALNQFMFSLTSVPHSAVDTTYRHGPDSDLPIPKLYFDEVLAKIHRTIHSRVDQMLALGPELKLDIPDEEQAIETLRRRTWLYVYPDPSSAEIAQQVMAGELEPEGMSYSQYRLSADQVERIRRSERPNIVRRLLGR